MNKKHNETIKKIPTWGNLLSAYWIQIFFRGSQTQQKDERFSEKVYHVPITHAQTITNLWAINDLYSRNKNHKQAFKDSKNGPPEQHDFDWNPCIVSSKPISKKKKMQNQKINPNPKIPRSKNGRKPLNFT